MNKREPKKIGYDQDKQGLVCRGCGCKDFITKKTERKTGWIYRYKACRNCDLRFHTKEEIIVEKVDKEEQDS